MPANTSRNDTKSSACRCDQNCGCCLKKKPALLPAEPKLGFFGKRPWLFVVFAFALLFSAWGALFYIAIKFRPETVPLATLSAE